jgi:hypothetical protein
MELSELDKLKAEKRLTAKKCCVEGCGKIGRWFDKNFYLSSGMCQMHYAKKLKYGHPLAGDFCNGRTKDIAWTPFMSMIQRCENKNSIDYPYYGGLGIKVSEEFRHNFAAFLEHIGERPSLKHSIDRYPDKNGNYERGNLRWATKHQQTANQKSNNKTVGVRFNEKRNKWHTYLSVNRVRVLSAYFNTEAEAIQARKDAEKECNIICG